MGLNPISSQHTFSMKRREPEPSQVVLVCFLTFFDVSHVFDHALKYRDETILVHFCIPCSYILPSLFFDFVVFSTLYPLQLVKMLMYLTWVRTNEHTF